MKAGILAGKRGIILGVSSENSAGHACAAVAIEQGATVAISHTPRREEAVRALASRLGAHSIAMEATDEASVGDAFERVAKELGGLDFVVHTLVRVRDGALARSATEISAAEFHETMEIGVRSLLVAARFAEPLLAESASPRIVALTSGGGAAAMPRYHVVGMAKAALEAAVRYLALELGPRGILCNAVSFSLVETDAAVRAVGGDAAQATRRHLAKRSMTQTNTTLRDVGNTVAYFVSPILANVTGELLTVDGGFSRSYF
ncbi:MAG: SDR family oxidoreductase [Polyangiaceae bacterium]